MVQKVAHQERLRHPEEQTPIAVVYAGGTISSLASKAGYLEGGHAIGLVQKYHEARPDVTLPLTVASEAFAYTGLSENITEKHQNEILTRVRAALAGNVAGVLVTHGTDSMEHTARFLHEHLSAELVRNKQRVILTGANQDLSQPTTDAWDNLESGLRHTASYRPGVYVAFHGRVIPAMRVVKEPFNGRQMNYIDTTDPSYRAALQLQEIREKQSIRKLEMAMHATAVKDASVLCLPVNQVRTTLKVLENQVSAHNVRAVVLRLYHSGTANTTDERLSIARFVERHRRRGIVFFGVTENGEPMDLHAYETSVALRQAGVVPLYNMTEKVAMAKLSLLSTVRGEQLIQGMLMPRANEVDPTRFYPEDITALRSLYNPRA